MVSIILESRKAMRSASTDKKLNLADVKFSPVSEGAHLMGEDIDSIDDTVHHEAHSSVWRKAHFAILYGIIVTLIASNLVVLRLCSSKDPSQALYSPAKDVIEYQTLVFKENFRNKGPYMAQPSHSDKPGIPSDQTDHLWEDLYQFGNSQIPFSQAKQLENATELIPGTSDQYVIQLDVFHQLHCLNALRKAFYPAKFKDSFNDYYFPNGTINYHGTDAKHLDHCIDSIRQSIMCHSDIATVYWRWLSPPNFPTIGTQTTHTCRNFDAIRDWAKDHAVQAGSLDWEEGPMNSFHQSFDQSCDYCEVPTASG